MYFSKTKNYYNIITFSKTQTKNLGFYLCQTIIQNSLNKEKKRCIIIIEGIIGSGKTIFTKGIAKKLGIKTEVKSPTFLLLKTHQNKKQKLHHLDLYRLLDDKYDGEKQMKCFAIEIEELLENTDEGDIVVIEANQNIISFFNYWDFRIQIKVLNSKKRDILIEKNIDTL
ncbi:tRNA (adenosine(37)-N6)-threonylcarbamoyltransferase complex ATPase subunit type 1 TsaE [Candidatus Phytoplasma ziziphi]|uniref:tRNA threonylcarbamoyladenosine biosynthesis protein TsaE n=1 Tax=Ziziphus jujuba witches'-broom phytoplasma TaxID=135727 RepID=A0A660HMS4_ZIZJU|nr:tRNA (adenosine(37)-N6)-threonylcarbamoyltransferase complex ATPase subunit type 1 TsaE [Candidatus Phytoplasma ziziphi]AYJ01325.1 tRNA (adenosine(37)-N6)-threonylcarbamoyltransferase complex ATPase subunit type 1 TsaE [Candidatus Phytoplasma ziziphi]